MVSVAAPLEARADDDRPGPRAEFERRGRPHLLEGSG
jgi:hypothetical protein